MSYTFTRLCLASFHRLLTQIFSIFEYAMYQFSVSFKYIHTFKQDLKNLDIYESIGEYISPIKLSILF